MTGVLCPGKGAVQSGPDPPCFAGRAWRFVGNPFSVETEVWSGPRQLSQPETSAVTGPNAAAVAARNRTRRFMAGKMETNPNTVRAGEGTGNVKYYGCVLSRGVLRRVGC